MYISETSVSEYKDLIEEDLVEIKYNYEWWALIGRWQNYSNKKRAKINAEIEKREKKLEKKLAKEQIKNERNAAKR